MMTKKAVAVVSYLTIIGWIIAFLEYKKGPKSSLTKYHLEQSFVLGIIIIITALITVFTTLFDSFFTTVFLIINVILVILMVTGILNAYYGIRTPIPFFGFYFKNKLGFIR